MRQLRRLAGLIALLLAIQAGVAAIEIGRGFAAAGDQQLAQVICGPGHEAKGGSGDAPAHGHPLCFLCVAALNPCLTPEAPQPVTRRAVLLTQAGFIPAGEAFSFAPARQPQTSRGPPALA